MEPVFFTSFDWKSFRSGVITVSGPALRLTMPSLSTAITDDLLARKELLLLERNTLGMLPVLSSNLLLDEHLTISPFETTKKEGSDLVGEHSCYSSSMHVSSLLQMTLCSFCSLA